MTLLSVIVPVYNVEKYLPECIESIMREAPESSEILLVDDGSPDGSPAICDDYAEKDKRIRVIHQNNRGLSGARNRGLDEAQGQYVLFIDSDDYLEDHSVETLLSRNTDMVIGNYRAFYEDHPDILGDFQNTEYTCLHDYLMDFHLYFPTVFNFAWGKLYDGEIIRDNHLRFQQGLSMVEDVLFNLEYIQKVKTISVCSDVVVNYRQIAGTLSKKYTPKLFDWYVQSYQSIEELLLAEDTMTTGNREHFADKLLGNVRECVVGIVSSEAECPQVLLQEILENALIQNYLPDSAPTGKVMCTIKRYILAEKADSLYRFLKVYLCLTRFKHRLLK